MRRPLATRDHGAVAPVLTDMLANEVTDGQTSNGTGASSSRETPVSSDDARRIVADIVVERAMKGALVEFDVGSFYNAPRHPVWLVRPRVEPPRVGASELFAICPETGRVLYQGPDGE